MKKKNIFYFLFFTMQLILAFAIGEILVRSLGLSKTWQSYHLSRSALNNTSLKDTTYQIGYRYSPNKKYQGKREVTHSINNEGFREKVVQKKAVNVFRIGVLGDSVVEGVGVEEDDRFSNKMENILNQTIQNKQYEVINMGIAGHSMIDHVWKFEAFAETYELDAIIIQICHNDFKEDYFKSRNINPQNFRNIDQNGKATILPYSNNFFKRFFQEYSALYLFFAEHYNTYKLRNGGNNAILTIVKTTSPETIKSTHDLLLQLYEKCLKQKSHIIVTYIPLDVEVQTSNEDIASKINDEFSDFCKSNNIYYASVIEALRSKRNNDIFLDDCHLTKEGNEIISEVLYSFIQKNDFTTTLIR
jgi:lysophospholipase L1-like esterase